MKFIKKYANFITESNLIKEDNQYVDVKMFLNGTKLTIKSNDKSADINLEVPKKLSFSKSFDQSTKKTFDSSIFLAKYVDMKNAFATLNCDIIGYDRTNQVITADSTHQLPYFVISVPKGYNGEVFNGGTNTEIGKLPTGAKVYTSAREATWAMFYLEDIQSSVDRIKGMNNIKITELPASSIIVNSPFEFDKWELTPEAKTKLNGLKGKDTVTILTGATQDGNPDELITKNGKSIKRNEWDATLVKNRYIAITNYLKSIGIKNIKISEKGLINGVYKTYGISDTKDLKNEKNRWLYIK